MSEVVSFRGSAGCFSEISAQEYFSKSSSPVFKGFKFWGDVFASVACGESSHGVVPIENSVSGTFHQIYELLLSHELYIVGEHATETQHALCVLPGVQKSDIREVLSDSHVLAQCDHFLNLLETQNGHEITRSASWDSAGSCEIVKSQNMRTSAVICSPKAAEIHGLHILESEVGNLRGMVTRYIVISKVPKFQVFTGETIKSSFAVCLKNQPREMLKMVSCFALRDIDISKLESNPACRTPQLVAAPHQFEYVFYLDVETKNLATLQNALSNLREFAVSCRELGTYKKNMPTLETVDHLRLPWTAFL